MQWKICHKWKPRSKGFSVGPGGLPRPIPRTFAPEGLQIERRAPAKIERTEANPREGAKSPKVPRIPFRLGEMLPRMLEVC